MQNVADLMTTNLTTLNGNASLTDAKNLMQEHNIRNLPIVDDDGKWLGMLTQREYLRHAFYLVSTFGTKLLAKKESDTKVASIANTEMVTLARDASLESAADLFIEHKYVCLPIVDQDVLVGILTPIDFVKLARDQLNTTT
ncbi:CBS domain-containing protein [Marinomonas agarivorans]|nr:CBS domain-containing protein [Marinomonas agarivorans]